MKPATGNHAPGSWRWHRTAIGAAGCYAAGVLPLLFLMAMEPTPDLLRSTAWILALVGLLVFASLFVRLNYLKTVDLAGDPDAKSKSAARSRAQRRDNLRIETALLAWINVAVFCICGLVWVFAAQAQCLLRGWALGQTTAEGCF